MDNVVVLINMQPTPTSPLSPRSGQLSYRDVRHVCRHEAVPSPQIPRASERYVLPNSPNPTSKRRTSQTYLPLGSHRAKGDPSIRRRPTTSTPTARRTNALNNNRRRRNPNRDHQPNHSPNNSIPAHKRLGRSPRNRALRKQPPSEPSRQTPSPPQRNLPRQHRQPPL